MKKEEDRIVQLVLREAFTMVKRTIPLCRKNGFRFGATPLIQSSPSTMIIIGENVEGSRRYVSGGQPKI